MRLKQVISNDIYDKLRLDWYIIFVILLNFLEKKSK